LTDYRTFEIADMIGERDWRGRRLLDSLNPAQERLEWLERLIVLTPSPERSDCSPV